MTTFKQKKVLEKIMENRGNVSKSMREAGYSQATAKNPKNLTSSKGWKELIEEFLPDEELLESHREFLGKKEFVTVKDSTGTSVEYLDQPHPDVLKALDLAYKLKSRYGVDLSGKADSDPKPNLLLNQLVKQYEEM